MKNIIEINISKDFSKFPTGRTPGHGNFNGETFRKKFLVENLKNPLVDKVIVNLDGVLMRGSSFFEEAFGGLIRVENISYDEIKRKIEIVYPKKPSFVAEIWKYISEANDVNNTRK